MAQRLGLMLVMPLAAATLGAGSAFAVPSVCDATAGNLVANCGFETTTDWSPVLDRLTNPAYVNSGSYAALLGAGPAPHSTIYQTIATTAGATYDLTFYIRNLGQTLTMAATFDGSTVLTTTPVTDETYHSFTTQVTASTASTVLQFDGGPGYGALDDVILVPHTTSTEPAPEPASIAVLGAGIAALTGLRRRRRSDHAPAG